MNIVLSCYQVINIIKDLHRVVLNVDGASCGVYQHGEYYEHGHTYQEWAICILQRNNGVYECIDGVQLERGQCYYYIRILIDDADDF